MLSRDIILKEYTKCLNDPIYFIESYFKTFDNTRGGVIPFKLFPRQHEVINGLLTKHYNLVTKPRQAGISTTTAAFIATRIAVADKDNPEAILIIANKQELAQEFLSKIKGFLDQVPRFFWGGQYYGDKDAEAKDIYTNNSKKEIRLPNKCRVKAVATSKDALRGYTPTYLIMDEAAHIENGEEVFGAALTSLGCITKDSLILTSNGLVELDELVQNKADLGFTNLDTPHMVCNINNELTEATQTFVSEYGETYKIKTKLGLELEGSWKHPIMIRRDNDDIWVKFNELKVGDKPLISYNQNIFGNNTIKSDLNEIYNVPYLMGQFVSNNGKYINDSLIIPDLNINIVSKKLVDLFKYYNITTNEISNDILKMNKNTILKFLYGVLNNNLNYINYYSINKKLISRLQILLLNLGVITYISFEDNKYHLFTKKHSNNHNLFVDEIDVIVKSKNHTYDLHVPHTNSFISNSFISHNTGGNIILISTPNGHDPLYYKTYEQAKKGDNDFNIIEMRWYEDLRYNKGMSWELFDENNILIDNVKEKRFTLESYYEMIEKGYKPTSPWYTKMCRQMNGDKRMIAQELDVSFIGSGDNVFEEKYIIQQEKEHVKEPLFLDGLDKKTWIWSEPIEGHEYILISDVSRGDSSDYSSIQIIDITIMEQVLEYQAKIPPDILGEICYEYAKIYDAFVVVDVTGGMGSTTILKIMELGWKNIYYDYGNNNTLINPSKFLNKSDKTPGFLITSSNRTRMFQLFEEIIRKNEFKIRSKRVISEMRTFIYKNGRPDHIKGMNDDCLISLVIGLYVYEHSFKMLKKSKNSTKTMLSSWVVNTGNTTITLKDEPKIKKKLPNSGYVTTRNNNNNGDDISWLLF